MYSNSLISTGLPKRVDAYRHSLSTVSASNRLKGLGCIHLEMVWSSNPVSKAISCCCIGLFSVRSICATNSLNLLLKTLSPSLVISICLKSITHSELVSTKKVSVQQFCQSVLTSQCCQMYNNVVQDTSDRVIVAQMNPSYRKPSEFQQKGNIVCPGSTRTTKTVRFISDYKAGVLPLFYRRFAHSIVQK